MSAARPPAWLERELDLAGVRLELMPYQRGTDYIVPVQGYKFWRTERDGKMSLGKWRSFGRTVVTWQYDGDHPEHGSQPFEPASNQLTRDRWVILQPVLDTGGEERVFDVIADDGSWLPLDGSLLMLLAMCKDRWDELEAEKEAQRRAVDKRIATTAEDGMSEPIEELVHSRSRNNWTMLNDATRENKPPTSPAVRVIDRRRFAGESDGRKPEPAVE